MLKTILINIWNDWSRCASRYYNRSVPFVPFTEVILGVLAPPGPSPHVSVAKPVQGPSWSPKLDNVPSLL